MKCEKLFYIFFLNTFYKRRGGVFFSSRMFAAWRALCKRLSFIVQLRAWLKAGTLLLKIVQKFLVLLAVLR